MKPLPLLGVFLPRLALHPVELAKIGVRRGVMVSSRLLLLSAAPDDQHRLVLAFALLPHLEHALGLPGVDIDGLLVGLRLQKHLAAA